ncbi:MAG: ABC transporter substrate-binding protein [Anaerolineae bacterium]
MLRQKLFTLVVLLALLVPLVLAAPGSPATPIVRAADPPQAAPQGAWLDAMVFSQQSSPSTGVSQLQSDALDLYAGLSSDPALFQAVLEDPDLTHTDSYGSYTELTFNPRGPQFDDGRLNPFSNAAIREAMNWLIDRDYIAQEIMGGMATPRWVPLLQVNADYTRYQATIEAIEAAYAYDLSQAQDAINGEMPKMDAYLQDGIWHYDGQPVTLIFLIRTEDERRDVGDYVADQLEAVGFSVDRQYKTSSEASSLWLMSEPAEGLWHLYTGGWLTDAVSRDDAENFGFFYTSLSDLGFLPLWQAYEPTAAFYDVCHRLHNRDFSSLAERDALFEQALAMAMDDGGAPPEGAGSVRVWLVDKQSFAARRGETLVASDLVGSVAGAEMFPYVARFEGVEGGDMRIAQPQLLYEPWNPIAGTGGFYEQMPIRATQDYGLITDPDTGLYHAQRVESAECVVKAGLPVAKTLDWVDLSFAPAVDVPADAWADWDALTQTFIEAGDIPTHTLEANTQCTVTYPADLFTTVTWHDGSPLDLADIVLRIIMTFDRGKPESAIYDIWARDSLDEFLSHFRGVKIVSTDPLIITTYDDRLQLDAELLVAPWWPNYDTGPGAWHNVAAGIRAEAAGQLAFSAEKADDSGIEWANYVGGASLDTLESFVALSAAEDYIPYQPTMGAYVTPAEADARWANLQAWYADRGHFWLGTGPFYLASVNPEIPTLTLQRYAAFPDPAGKWDAFVAADQPEVAINYDSGAPGSFFNVTGSGFPPDGTAFVVVNDTLLGSVPVSAGGDVAFTLSTGEADPGGYHLRVSVNPSAGLPFTLDESAPEHSQEGDLPLVDVPDGLTTHYIYLPLVVRS